MLIFSHNILAKHNSNILVTLTPLTNTPKADTRSHVKEVYLKSWRLALHSLRKIAVKRTDKFSQKWIYQTGKIWWNLLAWLLLRFWPGPSCATKSITRRRRNGSRWASSTSFTYMLWRGAWPGRSTRPTLDGLDLKPDASLIDLLCSSTWGRLGLVT